MLRIKFQSNYHKLMRNTAPVSGARLLDVIPVNLEDLSIQFLQYDTRKLDPNEKPYSLPRRGDYLMLIFGKEVVETKNIFTTLRRSTPEKLRYYRENIGEVFDVEIGDDVD